ncbi:MAG: biotin--[acetyl-CoA-carboxylase] ligase [Snowella sp.]|nr:biotin--[acetyl-CoA-carboxylase] ligase [Snowella sp.]
MPLYRPKLKTELKKRLDSTWCDRLSLLLLDCIPSTNQLLWDKLAEGKTFPLVAIADQQTAGRGQWGRTWQSEQGGLYLSLGLPLGIPIQQGAHITLWSAWGMAETLRQNQIPVGLKWPNDLVLNQRKLGGIKTETKVYQDKIQQAVIGVGLNWANAVPETGINLQTFCEQHHLDPIDPMDSLETLAAIALQGILWGYQRYCDEGIEGILAAYLNYFVNLGQEICVENMLGIITGVSEQGELKVRLQSPGATTEIHLPLGSIQLGYA